MLEQVTTSLNFEMLFNLLCEGNANKLVETSQKLFEHYIEQKKCTEVAKPGKGQVRFGGGLEGAPFCFRK